MVVNYTRGPRPNVTLMHDATGREFTDAEQRNNLMKQLRTQGIHLHKQFSGKLPVWRVVGSQPRGSSKILCNTDRCINARRNT